MVEKESDIQEEENITVLLSNSIFEDSHLDIDPLTDITFTYIESVLADHIPVVRALMAGCRAISKTKELFLAKKIISFISLVRQNIASEDLIEFGEKLQTDPHFQDRVMEHIIVMLDRFENTEKADILANLFIAFIKRDIDWTEFLSCSYHVDGAHLDALDCLYYEYLIHYSDEGTVDYFGIVEGKLRDSLGLTAGVPMPIVPIGRILCEYGLKPVFEKGYVTITYRDLRKYKSNLVGEQEEILELFKNHGNMGATYTYRAELTLIKEYKMVNGSQHAGAKQPMDEVILRKSVLKNVKDLNNLLRD